MFIPLHDANSLRHIKLQYVTIGLIAINAVVFLLTAFQPEQAQLATVYGLGYIPSVAFDTVELPPELVMCRKT
jgi:membrane associated rhomboid family serine protease